MTATLLAVSVLTDIKNVTYDWAPIVLMALICLLIWKGMGAIPRSKNKPEDVKAGARESVCWEDVAGVDEAKAELREVVEFLRNPGKFSQLGAKVPRGVLLSGPPGTGKTLLARAVASEAGAAFFAQSAAGFSEMYVGLGAARVRNLFKAARKPSRKLRTFWRKPQARPAIIFIDELDAVGAARGNDSSGEKDQTLNQLLVEMDGFGTGEQVVVIAASNLLDKLDPALLRPGRFDRQILVSAPDLTGREQILRVHTSGKRLGATVDLNRVARRTAGLAGAELANLCNEAAIFAGRENAACIEQRHFDSAMERVVAGVESRRVINDHEKSVVAHHEAGHALCSELLPRLNKVHKISIVPRGQALGYALNLPDEDRYLKSRSELEDFLVMLLGGRAAEQVIFGDITTGASDDLSRCYALSRQMVTQYAFADGLGVQQLPVEDYSMSDLTRQRVDAAQHAITQQAWERAVAMMSEHKETVVALAQRLLANETVEREDIVAVCQGARDRAAGSALTGPAPALRAALDASASVAPPAPRPSVAPPA